MGQATQKFKWATVLAALVLALLVWVGASFYREFYQAVVPASMDRAAFYIPTGSTAESVLASLEELGLVSQPDKVAWLMKQKNYKGRNVEPGLYRWREGMSTVDIVDHLRAGRGEEMVKLTIGSSRTLEELAGKVARQIEADSLEVWSTLRDPDILRKYGFNHANFKAMFLPDTYFIPWDTDALGFVERMASEFKKFWTEERLAAARGLGLSQSEVSTLASIVQAEQQLYPEERPRIAGLYLNRLKKGMKLQSDPTVVFAIGDFSINRVLTTHLQVDSRYNTYRYAGLPPGPINIPDKSSIEAVLYSEDNHYLFMCAKADFSGYHAFSPNLAGHNRNAAAYRRALNERSIYR